MKTLIISFFLFVALGLSAAYREVSGLPYSEVSDPYAQERCKLDIYYDDSAGANLPVVIWFHGGGLTGGEKFIPDELRESGLVVVAPNYRLLPKASIDNCIEDAASAVAWTFKNIKDFGGDPAKIFVTGHSAGGYLASLIGFDKKHLEKFDIDSDSIAGIVPYSGQAITHFNVRADKGIGELTPYIDEYAPMFHIRKDAPPYVIISGDAEEELYGRYEENLYLWRMLKLTGHPYVKIYKLDGYDHGAMAQPGHHILKKEIKQILKRKTEQ